MLLNPVMLITRKLRSRQVLKFLEPKEKHLDIGCGKELYVLKRSPCKIKKGLDMIYGEGTQKIINIDKFEKVVLYGQKIDKKINLNEKFDYITLVAVLEHVEYPGDVVKECYRLLKPGGKLILTTPTKFANGFIKIYAHKIQKTHLHMFDKEQLNKLISPYFEIQLYKKFEFGFNQLVVAKKKEKF